MLKKRLVVLSALALLSIIPPVVFQYIIEPRSEGANVTISIEGLGYNGDESDDEMTAFDVYLKLENDQKNDVIVSPLDLDVYYRSPDTDRYLLIGRLTTGKDYTVPAESYVASDENGRTDPNQEDFNRNSEIIGLLYFFKDPEPMKEAANEALVDLINKQSVDLVLKGEAKFGPVSIPFEAPDVTLSLDIWDPELIIDDVFLERTPALKTDSFVIHTLMRNPSGLPMYLEEFELGLYNETGDQVGWPINSIKIATSFDPDETSKTLAEVFLDKDISYKFEEGEKYTWRDVFLGFNFTDPSKPTNNENKAWLVRKLMDESVIHNVKLKGPATIILGQRDKGFKIDMTDKDNYLELSNVNYYQKYIDKYEGKAPNFGTPIKMFGNFTVDKIRVNKMIVDTKAETVRMDMNASMTLYNPYRFSYDVTNFSMSYMHNSGGKIADSESPTNAAVEAARRFYNATSGKWLKTVVPSTAEVPVNLTTTFDTGSETAGIYKVIEDLGGNPDLLNLTNPFYLDSNSLEHDVCPMHTIEYIIGQNVNPLTYLNEVSLLAQVKSYQPLSGQYFDVTNRPISQIYLQSAAPTDMPYCRGSTFYTGTGDYVHGLFCQVPSIASWNTYYPGYQADIRGPNKYEMIRHGFDHNFFPWDDYDGSMESVEVKGALYAYQGSARSGDPDTVVNKNGLIWRIYHDGSGTSNYGPDYSTLFDYGEKGYIMGMNMPSGTSAMFSQNFTLNPNLFEHRSSDIEKVTLSISYKYINPSYPTDNAYLMFAWFADDVDALPGNQPGFNYNLGVPAFKGRWGWSLPNSKDGGWNQYSMDLTDDFIGRIDDYYNNAEDPKYLRGEVSFSAVGTGGNTLQMYFDDIVLDIKYKDYITPTIGGLNLEDLFAYLENIDPDKGNMFNLFYQLADQGSIDASTFWSYVDGDLTGGPSQGMNFFNYLSYANVSLSDVTNILQNEYDQLDIPEPANFLDMLNHPRYEIHNDFSYNFENYINRLIPPTGYGPRRETTGYWTIEDPYNASREIVQNLYRNIFRDTDGQISDKAVDESELWFMLENLDVPAHWVVLYLLTHGWTKDDVFDVLEALGFGCEINSDWPTTWSSSLAVLPDPSGWGKLTAYLDVDFNAAGVDVLTLTNSAFDFDMGQILGPGSYKMFEALCGYDGSTNYPHAGEPGGRSLVNTYGSASNPTTTRKTSPPLIWGFISWTMDITPRGFSMEMYIRPKQSEQIVPSNVFPINFPDTYFHRTYPYGFLDPGTEMLASNMRINYKFAGSTFLTGGGDPVSLFQFLDNYWFAQRQDLAVNPTTVDYTSYTLLNYFNVSSLDFIDVITGYNNNTKDWDHNGNGRADDWVAPNYYGRNYNIRNPATRGLSGWGNNFVENRLYCASTQVPDYGITNGSIIWRDTPDFARDLGQHTSGVIYTGGGYPADDITEGAPPIVNLIDMLAWISEFSGKPDPDELTRWLLGELGNDKYQIVSPKTGVLADSKSNNGLSNQKVWRMLTRASLNSTGFFNWLEKTKNINSFKFLLLLDEATGIVNPLDLLFFATRANLIQFYDEALAWYYHEALGPTDSNNLLWAFFDLNSFDERAFFLLLNQTGFNIFDMFVYLHVDPASWLNKLNQDHGLEPIEIIKRMKKVEPGLQYIELEGGSYTIVDIKANLTVSYQGILLKELKNVNIADNKILTADYHFANFIDSNKLTGDKFVII